MRAERFVYVFDERFVVNTAVEISRARQAMRKAGLHCAIIYHWGPDCCQNSVPVGKLVVQEDG